MRYAYAIAVAILMAACVVTITLGMQEPPRETIVQPTTIYLPVCPYRCRICDQAEYEEICWRVEGRWER